MNKIKNAKALFSSKLTQGERIVTIGALVTIISLFLPWYRDIDAWGKGDTFLGITGPLSMIGLVILIASGAVFLQSAGKMFNKEIRTLKKYKNLSIWVAAENILLFVVTASIYFDPKFGVNITLKETAFGLVLCLAGSVAMGVGGYLKQREPATSELNVFEEVEANIERIHKEVNREEEITEEEPLAAKQYREIQEKDEKDEKAQTLRMDL